MSGVRDFQTFAALAPMAAFLVTRSTAMQRSYPCTARIYVLGGRCISFQVEVVGCFEASCKLLEIVKFRDIAEPY